MWCVVVCDLETSRIGAPYIYIISSLRVKNAEMWKRKNAEMWKRKNGNLSHESVLVQRKFPVTLTYKRRRCEKKLHRWHILY